MSDNGYRANRTNAHAVSTTASGSHERRGLLLSPDRRTFIQSMPYASAHRVSGNSVNASAQGGSSKRFAYTFTADRFRSQHTVPPSRQAPPPDHPMHRQWHEEQQRYRASLREEAHQTNASYRGDQDEASELRSGSHHWGGSSERGPSQSQSRGYSGGGQYGEYQDPSFSNRVSSPHPQVSRGDEPRYGQTRRQEYGSSRQQTPQQYQGSHHRSDRREEYSSIRNEGDSRRGQSPRGYSGHGDVFDRYEKQSRRSGAATGDRRSSRREGREGTPQRREGTPQRTSSSVRGGDRYEGGSSRRESSRSRR